MQTGEDIQGLRKIMDLTRLLSMAILAIHFYSYCHLAFTHWGFSLDWLDRIILKFVGMPMLAGYWKIKAVALILLVISLVGSQGRKSEKQSLKPIFLLIALGLPCYWLGHVFLGWDAGLNTLALLYMVLTLLGYLLILNGGIRLSRLIYAKLDQDIFNSLNETFPQEERLLENEYSINLSTRYKLKGKVRNGWLNIINPFRSILLSGSAGAGKTYFFIRHVVDQHIRKGFAMLVYDFKYSDLSTLAYNKLLQYQGNYKVAPKFYVINFDELMHRCNPLEPQNMADISDAAEASRTIMLGLNRDWVKKQGEFFVESAINFVTAVIWFLRKYRDGRYCTLPHVIELILVDYKQLFALLTEQSEIEALINPFVSAWKNEAWDQLEGQVGSTKINLARLVSPKLYYVMSGNDFSLDINNPQEPKIVCLGNNPQKLQVYGAVLSLYVNRILKLVNQKEKLKCSLVFDEYPTLVADLVPTITTARSNLVSCTMGIQSIEQLKKEYGAEQANIIAGVSGNIISGQVTGEGAKKLSETFGKIMQERTSMSINSSDTSISKSTQLEMAIPASRIASLSSGEFVGLVADNPDQKIPQKMFHAEIVNDHEQLRKEDEALVAIPKTRSVSEAEMYDNYLRIKQDIQELLLATLDDGN
jgi:hypothetical protein